LAVRSVLGGPWYDRFGLPGKWFAHPERSRRHPVADVTSQVRQRIERDLDRSLEAWSQLPRGEAEIDDWDQLDQIALLEEWPLEEEGALRLERYASEQLLTPNQHDRYEQINRLVAENRPIIKRLRAS